MPLDVVPGERFYEVDVTPAEHYDLPRHARHYGDDEMQTHRASPGLLDLPMKAGSETGTLWRGVQR